MTNSLKILNQNLEGHSIELTPSKPMMNAAHVSKKSKSKKPYLRPTFAYLKAMREADQAVIEFAQKELNLIQPLPREQYRKN